ncbi:MAG: hypothetical protein IIV41_02070 [Akkermansia sp.]|nr:hypothetical protein [Akkermansia sp.]
MVYLPNDVAVATQRKVVARRELFARVFTPEVMDELADFLQVKDTIFAFNGEMNPYSACQADTKMGVLRGIAWEAAHVDEARENLRKLEAADGEEVENA